MKRQPQQKTKPTSALDGLPKYVCTRIEDRKQAASRQRVVGAMGRATANLSPEECDEWMQRLRRVKPAALLPDDCHLSRQSRALFNLLTGGKGKAPFLKISLSLWPNEFTKNDLADLDPQSPKYHRLLARIQKAQKDLGKSLAKGGARYETHFDKRQGIVILEKL